MRCFWRGRRRAKQNVYDDFIDGAKDGFHTVIQIMPTLIGLMIGVGILRASGFLDFISKLIAPLTELVGFPSELVPVTVVKMFSSSAATGLLTDLFAKYGPDSFLGRTASVMMSCTETVFSIRCLSILWRSRSVKAAGHWQVRCWQP